MHFLNNLLTFCIISFNDSVNLGTYFLVPFQTIYALMLRISKCRKLCAFWHNFRITFLDKYQYQAQSLV